MTDEAALLAAVVAAPDDDTPRLVYADWLDDNGQAERAEFIRAQVRVARARPGDLDVIGVHQRQEELLRTYGQKWLPPDWNPGRATTPKWHRGFPSSIEVTSCWGPFPDAASLARVPTVQTLSVEGGSVGEDDFRGLAWLPNLREYRHVGASPLTPTGLATIARWPALRSLHLSHTSTVANALEGVAEVSHLRSLSLRSWRGDYDLTDADLEPLARLTELEELTLYLHRLTGPGFDALPAPPRLRRLRLYGCSLAAGALARLADCPSLVEVNLHGTASWETEASDALLQSLSRLPHLRVVDTIRPGTTERGYRALGRMTQLEELAAGGEGFGDTEIAGLTNLIRLQRLTLHPWGATPAGLALLGHLPALRELNLFTSPGFDADVVLDVVTRLTDLRLLVLIVDTMTDDHIGRLRELPHLKWLSLGSKQVTDRGIARLGPDSPVRLLNVTTSSATREFVWDRRVEWAPRLEAVFMSGPNLGLAGIVDYSAWRPC